MSHTCENGSMKVVSVMETIIKRTRKYVRGAVPVSGASVAAALATGGRGVHGGCQGRVRIAGRGAKQVADPSRWFGQLALEALHARRVVVVAARRTIPVAGAGIGGTAARRTGHAKTAHAAAAVAATATVARGCGAIAAGRAIAPSTGGSRQGRVRLVGSVPGHAGRLRLTIGATHAVRCGDCRGIGLGRGLLLLLLLLLHGIRVTHAVRRPAARPPANRLGVRVVLRFGHLALEAFRARRVVERPARIAIPIAVAPCRTGKPTRWGAWTVGLAVAHLSAPITRTQGHGLGGLVARSVTPRKKSAVHRPPICGDRAGPYKTPKRHF